MKLWWILIVLYYLSNHCMCHMGHQLEELFGSGKNPDKVKKIYDYFLTVEIISKVVVLKKIYIYQLFTQISSMYL